MEEFYGARRRVHIPKSSDFATFAKIQAAGVKGRAVPQPATLGEITLRLLQLLHPREDR